MFFLTGAAGTISNLVSLLSDEHEIISDSQRLKERYLGLVDRIGGVGTHPNARDHQITFDEERIERLAARHLGARF